jgi:4-amino-4-deoxy-L-arabinose transferase-like glycosyltransferase
VGIAVRILFATVLVPQFEHRAGVAADPDQYVDLAASLIDRGELGFTAPGSSPTSVRGPAFPLWLAIGMSIGGRSEGWVAFWACVPGLIAAATIATILSRTYGRSAGLAGGLLCAVHPLACFMSARVLPDEFYGATLFLGLVAWQSSLRSARTWQVAGWAGLAGVLLASASLTRVTAIGVLLFLMAFHLWIKPRRWLSCAVTLVVAAAILAPWTWRTSALVGRPTVVESLAGYNFWLGSAADRYGFASGYGQARERAHALMAEEAGADEVLSPAFRYPTLSPRQARELDDKLRGAAWRSIASRPFAYAARCGSGLLWFWIRAETAQRTIQYALVALPLIAMGLFGLRKLSARPDPAPLPVGLVVAIILAHLLVYAAICPMARYSVQVYPLVCYLAGAGFAGRSSR